MNFKELFDKEFLYESKKEDKKSTKIFYEFDINIQKIEDQQANQTDQNTAQPAPDAQTDPNATQPVADPNAAQPAPAAIPATPDGTMSADATQMDAQPMPDLSSLPMPSVVTEDDDDNQIQINDENNIIRKLKGEIVLDKEEVDNIQTVEDLIGKLEESKQDGAPILDEFTSDILITMANPATQMDLKQKIGQESKIFAEVLYGKKPEDSVGLRFIKRKGSDLITTSMMIDNKIINAQYRKETLDKRITDYRNDEFEEK